MKTVYIEPPQVSAAFYFGSGDSGGDLVRVCRVLGDTRPIHPVSVEFVRAPSFPRFAQVSDLAPGLQTARLDPREPLEPDLQVVRATFTSPDVDAVAVGFDMIPDTVAGLAAHPVAVTVSGALLSMPPGASLTARERRQAARVAEFVLAVFRAVCESLDPLYGAIQVEDSLPTPPELAGGEARIGTEVFVSERLLRADERLRGRLAELFAEGVVEDWAGGIFASGWAALNREGRSVSRPLAVRDGAGRAVAAALARLPLGPA